MGSAAVLADLPRLMRRIGETARAIVAEKPDCLMTIDSPDFTLRVAKKVRAANPFDPDHPLCLPERLGVAAGQGGGDEAPCRPHTVPAALRAGRTAAARRPARNLRRPPADQRSRACCRPPSRQARARDLAADREKTLLLLPGSRKGEVTRLIGPFGETVRCSRRGGTGFGSSFRPFRMSSAALPTRCRAGRTSPRSCSTSSANGRHSAKPTQPSSPRAPCRWNSHCAAFRWCPATSSIRWRELVQHAITVWSALLPNLIADRPVAPEFYDRYVRPGMLARHIEAAVRRHPAAQPGRNRVSTK